MQISSNLLKLVLLVCCTTLMIVMILRPGSDLQDAISHSFAVMIGVIIHENIGGKKDESNP